MDEIDRQLINRLQDGISVEARPFRQVAAELGVGEADIVARLQRLVDTGKLSRFGPLYNAERLGGAVTLAAMAVPAERFDEITQIVNAHPEVAHNYAREHALNMWFVVATETPDELDDTLEAIGRECGLPVLDMPREREYFIGLRFQL